MATYVTDKFGVTTAAMVTRAKGFYDVRYRMIWDRYYWKQTKVSESSTVSASTQDVTLTAAIDRVVAVRWNNRRLLPVNQEQVFQLDPEAFDSAGEVVGFSELPKDSSGLTVIRLYEIPQDSKELMVLGKAPPETLTDSETPRLSGIDQSLQAYVLGDLWQSIRQFSKADILYREAETFLQQMIKIEEEQSAYDKRIIPSDDEQYDRDDLFYE
jgi:hypothetical protein